MKKIAKSIRSHRELILNYLRAKKQFSSGIEICYNAPRESGWRVAAGWTP